MTNLYVNLQDKHQAEYDAFPMIFAFSNEQFEQGLKKLDATPKEIVSLGYGTYIRKADISDFEKMVTRLNNEKSEMLNNNDRYLYQAFLYELANHEYGYTYDIEPTLQALNLTADQVANDHRLVTILDDARNEYLANCHINNY